jgi:Tfp pilus assembly protein PilF
MAVYRWLASLLVCLVMSACGTFSSKGEMELGFGIRAYEDGEHPYAARLLQASLDSGLRDAADRARAHKYLAFIHCASSRVQQCRDEFKKALEIDSSFDLRDDEVGHPTWGPVFRSVKPKK